MDPAVATVVEELDAHRARFESFSRSLSAAELASPVPGSTWQVRDFIAHLGTIDVPVGEMFRAMHDGGRPASIGPEGGKWDIDSWNDSEVDVRRGRSVEELLAEAAATRATLHAHLAALTAEDVTKTLKFGGDNKRGAAEIPLLAYLRGWCKHDPIHVADMLRGLPDRHTPDVLAWVDDPVIKGYQAQMNRKDS
jgi:hypothetical protein